MAYATNETNTNGSDEMSRNYEHASPGFLAWLHATLLLKAANRLLRKAWRLSLKAELLKARADIYADRARDIEEGRPL